MESNAWMMNCIRYWAASVTTGEFVATAMTGAKSCQAEKEIH